MADDLRFQVQAGEGDDFEVLVFVNGVEMTSKGAGMGMDPYDIFVPENRLRPADDEFEVPIARCNCGVYGCGSTDVRIAIEDQFVRWDWLIEKPGLESSRFNREAYERALATLESDRSWETPVRTAGRLVLGALDRAHLSRFDLRPSFVCNDWRTPTLFQIVLNHRDTHQIFVRFDWNDDSPELLASRVVAAINGDPQSWKATWHQCDQGKPTRPYFATWRWKRERL